MVARGIRIWVPSRVRFLRASILRCPDVKTVAQRKVRIRMLMYMHGCMEDGRWGMHRSFTTLMIMAGTISDVSPSDRTYIAVQRMYSATTALHR